MRRITTAILILFSILTVLNFLDAYTTFIGLQPSTANGESNIFAAYIFTSFGLLFGIILLKTMVIVINAVCIILFIHLKLSKFVVIGLSCLNIFYVLLILNNMLILHWI